MKSLINKIISFYINITDKEQMYLDIAVYMSIIVGIVILWSVA